MPIREPLCVEANDRLPASLQLADKEIGRDI
jgi:hypothetical protein